MIARSPIKKHRPGPPRKGRVIDRAYKEFIAYQPCVACYPPWFHIAWPERQKSHTEVAHVGDRGLSQKCSDRETLPLCTEHHRSGNKSHHVLGRRFWTVHNLDRDSLIAGFQARYEMEKAA